MSQGETLLAWESGESFPLRFFRRSPQQTIVLIESLPPCGGRQGELRADVLSNL
jgi:hypothetical protein